jgi:hypothetical protein
MKKKNTLPKRSVAVQAAIEDVKRALATTRSFEDARRRRMLIGRWALPSGYAFMVKHINPQTDLALCRVDARCWNVPVADLLTLLKRKQLRYLGR